MPPLTDQLSTLELMNLLSERNDLESLCNPETGRLSREAFKVRRALGPIICTDMVPVFQDKDGTVYGACIVRGDQDNPFFGKYAYIGGVVGRGVLVEDAMRYHSKIDVNLSIEFPLGVARPVWVNEYYPVEKGGAVRPGFLPEWDKHSVGLLHLVFVTGDNLKIQYGSKSNRTEALGFHVFSLADCPPESEWAYGQRAGFCEVLEEATHQRDNGWLTLPMLPEKIEGASF